MSEAKRGCGYRQVGALYLCGEYAFVGCDRLPYELKSCPTCGAGIHFTRSMTKIDPLKLLGTHEAEVLGHTLGKGTALLDPIVDEATVCQDQIRPCLMCDPTSEPAYIRTIGKKSYSPISFMDEAKNMGVSLRMAQIPKNLKLGKTVVYLAHPHGIIVENKELNYGIVMKVFVISVDTLIYIGKQTTSDHW